MRHQIDVDPCRRCGLQTCCMVHAIQLQLLKTFKGTGSISRPWLGLLPIVDLAQICIRLGTWYPEEQERCTDLNPSINRAGTPAHGVSCVKPGSRHYLGHRCRLALGVESMHLQGQSNKVITQLELLNLDFQYDKLNVQCMHLI